MFRLQYILFAWLLLASCRQEQTIQVEIEVLLHIADDHTSPLPVTVENKTRNADGFRWTFAGGSPAASTKKNPGTVIFHKAGEHTVTLEAWNDGDRKVQTFVVRVNSVVTADFKAEVEINNFAPAVFHISNLTEGGTTFLWSFEGGEPSVFEGKAPPAITYNYPGTYKIHLTVNNGSAVFHSEQAIEVRETLDASFTVVPSFEDEDDMEAPVRATFDTHLQGTESLLWECEGAVISNATSTGASILFPHAGDYTVFLKASNGKQQKIVSQTITVKPNTNLRTHRDIRLGINTAQEAGVLYSTKLRRKIATGELNEKNGPMIDIVYYGLNDRFMYNRFISPQATSEFFLPAIPAAVETRFVNKIELSDHTLTHTQFEAMTTDALLKPMEIEEQNSNVFFDNTLLLRVILFETYDKRKGAILVKEMVSLGAQDSYILIDIKVQKND